MDRLIGFAATLVIVALLLPIAADVAHAAMPALLMLLVCLVGFRWLLSWLGF